MNKLPEQHKANLLELARELRRASDYIARRSRPGYPANGWELERMLRRVAAAERAIDRYRLNPSGLPTPLRPQQQAAFAPPPWLTGDQQPAAALAAQPGAGAPPPWQAGTGAGAPPPWQQG